MVRSSHLQRTSDESDRRAIKVTLTEQGRRLLTAYDAAREGRLKELFAEFPPEELRRAAQLLDQISAAVVRQTAKAEELCLQCGIHFRERCLVRQLLRTSCSYQQQRDRRRLMQAAAQEAVDEHSDGLDRGEYLPQQP